MAKTSVYFFKVTHGMNDRGIADGIKALFKEAKFKRNVPKDALTAIKTHFGEKGNKGFIPPLHVRAVVECVEGCGAKAFVTETNTLYVGSRSNSYDHLMTAAGHGFTHESLGAPLIIADGLRGQNRASVEVRGEYVKEAHLAPDIVHADALIVLSHLTGHMLTGFACAIKNISMGCATRGGKLAMHADVKPSMDPDKCTGCGTCADWCPADAITIAGEHAVIDHETCIGCGECVAVCRTGAVKISWTGSHMQEKMAEYALAAASTKKNRLVCINFLTYITKNCNCIGDAEAPEIKDIGIMASTDPVAGMRRRSGWGVQNIKSWKSEQELQVTGSRLQVQ
jgi:uncharacterized Fe-S center protein